jgi:hypothetical protein
MFVSTPFLLRADAPPSFVIFLFLPLSSLAFDLQAYRFDLVYLTIVFLIWSLSRLSVGLFAFGTAAEPDLYDGSRFILAIPIIRIFVLIPSVRSLRFFFFVLPLL